MGPNKLDQDQKAKIENWELAFTLPVAGCLEMCHCGKMYYNPGGGWDWEEGELEALEADQDAISVDYSVGLIHFEGIDYANPCDCWHERALKIIAFLEGHREGINAFFQKEKARAQAHADLYPELEIYGEGKIEVPEGYKPMGLAPKGSGKRIEIITKRGTKHIVHWAQDLSGEEQPPFSGWFEEVGKSSYREVSPIAWKECRA